MNVLPPLSPSHSRPPENPNAASRRRRSARAHASRWVLPSDVAECALEGQVVVGDVELDALADAAAGAEPGLHPARPAADALGGSARDGVEACETLCGIGSKRAGRSAIGIDVCETTPANRLRSPHGASRSIPMPATPAHRRSDRLAVRGLAGETGVFEIIRTGLPAQAVDLAGGRAGGAPHVAAAGFDLRLRRWLSAAACNHSDHAADRVGAVERALRSAQHLDALDILQRHLRQIEAAAERIGANPVDQDQRVVGFAAAREERRHRAGPPFCCSVRPGTERSADDSVNCCFASISRPGITVTLSGMRDSG